MSRRPSRTVDWFSQEEFRPAKHYVARGGGRSTLFWMDRWIAQECRRAELQNSLHSAAFEKHLECNQCSPDGTARSRRPCPPGWQKGVRATLTSQIRHLFLRKSKIERLQHGGGAAFPVKHCGLELVSRTNRFLSPNRHLVGHQCETSGDGAKTARHVNRRFKGETENRTIARPEGSLGWHAQVERVVPNALLIWRLASRDGNICHRLRRSRSTSGLSTLSPRFVTIPD
jgi:hypothetical protein